MSATLAQFLALDSYACDVGGAELALLGRAGERVTFSLSNRELASLASAIGEHFGTPGTLTEATLLTRVAVLEREIARLSERAGRPDLRDMGATLVDKARARYLEARADRLEKETAAEYAAPVDPGPLAAHSVSVDNELRRPGERILRVGFSDGAGRDVVVALPFALALKLNGSIGRAIADRIDAQGER